MHIEKCFAFSPQEVEKIAAEYSPEAEVLYEGGVVTVAVRDENGDVIEEKAFQNVAAMMRPELGIDGYAEAIYEQSYQDFRADSTVLVINGVFG